MTLDPDEAAPPRGIAAVVWIETLFTQGAATFEAFTGYVSSKSDVEPPSIPRSLSERFRTDLERPMSLAEPQLALAGRGRPLSSGRDICPGRHPSGGRAEGIALIEEAASKGADTQTDALLVLMIIDNREGKHREALGLLDRLQTPFPEQSPAALAKAR